MALYAIADLHLSLGTDKPMDVFGERWRDYVARLEQQWMEMITEKDTVLVPGDISWAMTMEEALLDLRFLDRLPGQKILVKGNHDFWWGTNGKVEKFMGENAIHSIALIKNNAIRVGHDAVCGTRGWLLPEHSEFSESDRVIYDREAGRLERSLIAGQELCSNTPGRMVAMLHFPPIGEQGDSTAFSVLLEKYGVEICVYGHLHGRGHVKAFEGTLNGVQYRLIAGDYIAFKPLRL
jgi:predicted phosphohydrolase